ncbi:MAG: hypothetical protein ABH863_02290 [Candidatus Micrarchaeota archaeon]
MITRERPRVQAAKAMLEFIRKRIDSIPGEIKITIQHDNRAGISTVSTNFGKNEIKRAVSAYIDHANALSSIHRVDREMEIHSSSSQFIFRDRHRG